MGLTGSHLLLPTCLSFPYFLTDYLLSFYHGFALSSQQNPWCGSLFWCLLAVVDRGMYSVTRETECSQKEGNKETQDSISSNLLLTLMVLIIMGYIYIWLEVAVCFGLVLSPSLPGDMVDCLPLVPQNAPCSLPDLIWRLS